MIIKGEVIDGYGRAARLGFPTANMSVGQSILKDFDGVYAGMTTVKDKQYESVIFFDKRRGILESHILDFKEDVRGEIIEVELLKKIRATKQFSHDDELIEQLRADANNAKDILHVSTVM